MKIIFNNAITKVNAFPKLEASYPTGYRIADKFKVFVGYKFYIIPMYERVTNVVVRDYCDTTIFISSIEDFNDPEFYFEDGKFYHKPHCDIFLNNGSKETKIFESVDDLNDYINSLKQIAEHITIE